MSGVAVRAEELQYAVHLTAGGELTEEKGERHPDAAA
jgi:hypothetical protein